MMHNLCYRVSTVLVLTLLATSAAVAADPPSTVVPVPREGGWIQRHNSFNERVSQGDVGMLMIGDSITQGWEGNGKEAWAKHLAPRKAVNLGIGGDRTQHVLWRMQNGELDGIKPKAVVMMIGTNNTGFERDNTTPRNTPSEIAEGVAAIVKHLRAKQPQAKILLLAIFPRGEKPDHPQRKQIAQVNAIIAKLHDGKNVHFLDIGKQFLAADGTLPKEIMPDFLHLTPDGYARWAAAIKQPLAKLLK